MSDGTTTHDLSAKPEVIRPGDINYWAIPGVVLISTSLWLAVLITLKLDHDPAVSTTELALFIGTGVGTVSTVFVVREYLIHKAVSANHAAILQEVADLRDAHVVAAAEQRSLIEQISAKIKPALDAAYWHGYASGIRDNSGAEGDVVPLRRH